MEKGARIEERESKGVSSRETEKGWGRGRSHLRYPYQRDWWPS